MAALGEANKLRFVASLIADFPTLVYWMGAPGSMELSPVPLVAVLFPLYFGWMFGDVGHGLLLALFAVSLYKLGKRDWAWIWGFPAVSAVLFGLYYGEAFGIRDGEAAVTPLEGIASAVLFGFTVLILKAAVSAVFFGLYCGGNSARRHSLCRVVWIYGVNT